ncbi:MAG: glycosyltransferase family 2 protein [Flavobacteriaceae bacterium]
MPKFSVIIPLFNKDAHIYNTLISVLDQSYTNYEIIVVNDGSTDDSLLEAKKISDERLTIYDRENNGVSQARNFAMQQAKGDYFAFLDADDIWKVNHLQNLNELITEFPNCGMYCTNYQFDFGNNYIINTKFPTLPKISEWSGIVPDFFEASMKNRIALTSAVAIHKNIINSIGDFSPKITSGQDTDFWSRIALKNNIAFTKKISVTYNAYAINRITDTALHEKKLMTFDNFIEEEKNNPSLKKFNDMYRVEYALHQKMSGNFYLFEYYKKGIDYNSIGLKNRILLNVPKFALISLWQCKQWGKKLKRLCFIVFK